MEKKELVAISDGYRESKQSWKEILLDLKYRGLQPAPELAIGDGALGFWSALAEVYATTRQQRCWVHKTSNILDKMPKSVQAKAKSLVHEMYMSETREKALQAYEQFVKLYKAKYPKACECLIKDKDVLFTFYDFPAEHWVHLRSTNPIESTFCDRSLTDKTNQRMWIAHSDTDHGIQAGAGSGKNMETPQRIQSYPSANTGQKIC